MKRLWLLWLLPLLLGAGSPPVRLNPEQGRLGETLLIRMQLPAQGWQLSGYPDLGPFRLLEKAVITADQLQLKLLPLRPGKTQIPTFSLFKGSRVWQTPVLQIEIDDPYQQQEQPSHLRPFPGQAGRDWLLALLCLLLVTPVAGGVRLLKQRRSRRSAPENPLELMAQRLAPLEHSADKQRLQSTLTAWRFGPYPPSPVEIAAWHKKLTQLEQAT